MSENVQPFKILPDIHGNPPNRCPICGGQYHEVCPWKEEAEKRWLQREGALPLAALSVVSVDEYTRVYARSLRLEADLKTLNDGIATIEHIDFKKDERLNFTVGGEGAKLFANLVAGMFYQNGAQNFLECQLKDKDNNVFLLNIQKADGKTPAERIKELEEERGMLQVALGKAENDPSPNAQEIVMRKLDLVSRDSLAHYGERVREEAAKVCASTEEKFFQSNEIRLAVIAQVCKEAIHAMPLPDPKETK